MNTSASHPVGSCGGTLRTVFGCSCIASDSAAGQEVSITDLTSTYFGADDRREALRSGGFVEPTSIASLVPATTIAERAADWDQTQIALGHGGEASDYSTLR